MNCYSKAAVILNNIAALTIIDKFSIDSKELL